MRRRSSGTPLDSLPLVSLLLISALGCGAQAEPSAPTYHADVAPIVARSCLSCHGDQDPTHGVSLADYGALRAYGPLALQLMESGLMPKGGLDRSGACGRFVGPVTPTAQDLAVFASWVDHGMPEGPARPAPDAAESRPFVVDATAALPEPYWPAMDETRLTGDHRCFGLSAPAAAPGALLHAFRVVPSAPELVHHALLFAIDTPADAAEVEERDQSDPGPGWACFGTPGVAGARLLGAWAPGAGVVGLPPGFAVRLGTSGLVVQMHYDGPPATRPDQTEFEFETTGAAAREARFLPFAATDLVLPPQQESVRVTRVDSLGLSREVELLGVFPHMHLLGRSLELGAVLQQGGETCLASVPRWDYAWQELGLYVEAPRLPADALLSLECRYTTLGVERTVTWGERMEDEMCMAFVLVAD